MQLGEGPTAYREYEKLIYHFSINTHILVVLTIVLFSCNYNRYIRWIDYVQSKRRGSNRPVFVYSILFACTVTLIASIGINGWKFESFSLNPSFGPSAETLVVMGAKESSLIVNDYQIWRLVTPMFLRKFAKISFSILFLLLLIDSNEILCLQTVG